MCSHAFLRSYREIPVPFFPVSSMMATCKTTVQHHKQDTEIDAIKEHFCHHKNISCDLLQQCSLSCPPLLS